jgi:hypothetical protein
VIRRPVCDPVVRLLLVASVASAVACKSEEPPPPPPGPDICCSANDILTVRSACEIGEVELPIARCRPVPDAGVVDSGAEPCGDGVLDPTTEQCDLSATGGTCSGNRTCEACQCVSMCGNDVVNPPEQCEFNSECPTTEENVCRNCSCALASLLAEFMDPVNDLAAGIDSTESYLDIRKVGMAIDSSPMDRFEITLGETPAAVQETLKICLVLVQSDAEVGRLCFERMSNFAEDIRVSTVSTAERSIMPEASVTVGGGVVRFSVPASANLPYGSDAEFYWYTELGGVQADRYPDTGTTPLSEIIGR